MNRLTENIKAILGIMVLFLSFAYIFFIAISGIQSDIQVMTFVIASCTIVLNYFLGSSASSAKKDETILNIAKKSTSPLESITGKEEQPESTAKVEVVGDVKIKKD